MNAAFIKTCKGINAYIQKSVRVDGKSITFPVKNWVFWKIYNVNRVVQIQGNG